MTRKISTTEYNKCITDMNKTSAKLREIIIYLHTNQIAIRTQMKDQNIVPKIIARIYHDRLVGINTAVYDESLEISERVKLYFTNEHDSAYGMAMAYRFGLTLTAKDAVEYDVLKYTGDMRIMLTGDELVNYVRYVRELGAVVNNPKHGPATDGINHINIYSKGKTEVGRILSNFNTPFFKYETPHGKFRSLEGYYHWLRVLEYHHIYCGWPVDTMEVVYPKVAKLRGIDGESAIRLGRTCKAEAYAKTKFRPGKLPKELMMFFATAMVGKLFRVYYEYGTLGEYISGLHLSGFKFVHYYSTENGIKYPNHGEWLPDLITGICSYIDPMCGTTTEKEILSLLPEIIGD